MQQDAQGPYAAGAPHGTGATAPAPPPPAPPTWSPPPGTPRRSAWPTAVGITSICISALTLACDLITMAMQLILSQVIGTMSPAGAGSADALKGAFLTSVLLGGGNVACGIVLLVAGILLLGRRPAGRTAHLLYAVLRILTLSTTVAVMALAVGDMTAQAATAPASGPAGPPPAGFIVLTGGFPGMVSHAIGLFYPVFVLAWFLRRPIAEEARSWALARGEPADNPPFSP